MEIPLRCTKYISALRLKSMQVFAGSGSVIFLLKNYTCARTKTDKTGADQSYRNSVFVPPPRVELGITASKAVVISISLQGQCFS